LETDESFFKMSERTHRYELKFLIQAKDKPKLLADCQPCMMLDPHAPNGSYPISSLYFDSLDKKFYHEKINGVGKRLKIRLRWYGFLDSHNRDQAVCYLEVKHRLYECVAKERITLNTEQALQLLHEPHRLHSLSQFVTPTNDSEAKISDLIELHAGHYQLLGSNIISYTRTPWMGTFDKGLRLTFDHNLQVLPPHQFEIAGHQAGIDLIPLSQAVMEIKFNSRIPAWLKSQVSRHDFQITRFSKYAQGVQILSNPSKRLRNMKSLVLRGPRTS
jgi:SPX domain protein involved in polyphosphate accumulation